MATQHLTLRRCRDGYYRTSWYDELGKPHQKSFGKARGKARSRFDDFYARWKRLPGVRNPDDLGPLTVRDAWQRFKKHAEAYYRHGDGTPTGEALNVEHAVRELLELYGGTPAEEFGPKRLKDVREAMIAAKLSRGVINDRVKRIRRVFKWLVSEQIVPANVWHGLLAVEALRAGRKDVVSTEPVGPVPDEHVWETIKHVGPTVAAMIEVQYWTGMRPGEVCAMRPMDLDTTGRVWVYRPVQHKTLHRGRLRQILIGPKGQRVIEPFLQRDLSAALFSPLEARRQQFAACGTHSRRPPAKPKTSRRVRRHYTTMSYSHRISAACLDHDIPHWSPGQLRHNAATRLRKEYGLDVAQVVLGHAKADVTQLYAELDLKKAIDVMERVG